MANRTVGILFYALLCFINFVVLPVSCIKKCNSTDVRSPACDEFEMCVISKVEQCECLPDFRRNSDGICVSISTNNSNSSKQSSATAALVHESTKHHIVTGLVIPLLVLLIVISAFYAGKKYDVVGWIRGKLDKRSSNYDEVMIGQDDEDDDLPLQD